MSIALTHISWEMRAACRGSAAALFMPPIGRESADERTIRELAAKDICAGCPVVADCLEYALRVQEPIGIWGGLNETERRRLGTPAHG